jgi:hypothetical protein
MPPQSARSEPVPPESTASSLATAWPIDGLLPIGTTVQLIASQRYLKTADPMPMLRPPDLVDPGETGQIVEWRAAGQVAVRFRRGTFLLAPNALTAVANPDSPMADQRPS